MTQVQEIKGYKAIGFDMKCRGFQYQIGKTFVHDGEIELCKSGFHFSTNLNHVFNHYPVQCRIFKVIGRGQMIVGTNAIVCSEIEIVEELDYDNFINATDNIRICALINVARTKHNEPELHRLKIHERNAVIKGLVMDDKFVTVYATNSSDTIRMIVASCGKALHRLRNDSCDKIRAAVADQGKYLDVLMYDKSELVRAAVARQGYGLDILVKDKHYMVRAEVAKKTSEFDHILVDDSEPYVRRELVTLGRELTKLKNDVSPIVRKRVADIGYNLETLINDNDKYVRDTARKKAHDLELDLRINWFKSIARFFRITR